MNEHALIALIGVGGGLLQIAGLVVLGWQLKDARREAHEHGQRLAALAKAAIDHLAALRGQR